jgi:hypothetical protein
MLVVLPFVGGVTDVGAKLQDAPLGNPEQARATALAKPFVEVTEQVLGVLPPGAMVKLDGLHDTLKSGVGAVPQVGNL